VSDDFDEFIDKIKKYFKLDSDIFDVDFIFIPDSETDLNLRPKKNKPKGFKISYHFESGMKEPEFKIEGNIDDKRIREYFKNIDLSRYPTFKKLFQKKSFDEIDASKLSLAIPENFQNQAGLEPHTEIVNYEDYMEIVLDIPGISEEDVIIDVIEGGTTLRFVAETNNRKYIKNLALPFKSSTNSCELKVNNGLAVVKIRKPDN
jgi:HSP20 family molecular chaperone IbpA